MNNMPLIISIECPENKDCIYTGTNLPIRIIIKNVSKNEVDFPLEYVNRVGPHIKLTDATTRKERRLRVSLAPRNLPVKFETIPPQGFVEMNEIISASKIKSFRDEFIDLEVEVEIAAEIRFGNIAPVKYAGVANFKIVGKDTVEQRNLITRPLRP